MIKWYMYDTRVVDSQGAQVALSLEAAIAAAESLEDVTIYDVTGHILYRKWEPKQ